MNKMTETYSKIKVPAGTYYIGDLCYVIHDDVWDEVCEAMFPNGQPNPKDGLLEVRGHQFISFSTMWGDGTYYGGGHEFPVDAGLIGLISVESLQVIGKNDFVNEAEGLGAIVTFDEDFICHSRDGWLTFGNIVIDTAGDCEEEDEEEDQYEDEY